MKIWTSKIRHNGYEREGRDGESLRAALSHVAVVLIEGKVTKVGTVQMGMSSKQAQMPDVQWYRCWGGVEFCAEDWIRFWTCDSDIDSSSRCLDSGSATNPGGWYNSLMLLTYSCQCTTQHPRMRNDHKQKQKTTQIRTKNVAFCKWDIRDIIML